LQTEWKQLPFTVPETVGHKINRMTQQPRPACEWKLENVTREKYCTGLGLNSI